MFTNQEKSEANENDDGSLCNLIRISWIVTGEVILNLQITTQHVIMEIKQNIFSIKSIRGMYKIVHIY